MRYNNLIKTSLLSIAFLFCGVIVEAQTKVILEKTMPLSKQITIDNCTYVINNVMTLDRSIHVPDNCVLELDGGCIIGNYDIYLGKHCKIIGHGTEEIRIGGSFYLNHRSYISNINLVRNTAFKRTDDSFIVISDGHIKYPNNSNVNANVVLDNVTITYTVKPRHGYGNAIEIVSGNGNKKDKSFYKGMYNFSFSKVYVNGYFNRAFFVHALEDGWITELSFDDCFIDLCSTGWKIDSYSQYPIQQVNITNSGMQNNEWTYYAVDCGKAEIYVYNLRTWDWWNNHNVGSPFRFTEETRKSYIDVLHESRRYDYVSENNQFNNNIHVEHWTYDRDIERIIDLKQGFVKLVTLYTLPNGTYRIPQDKKMINALGIDANVLGGTMIVSGGINEKLLFFVSNYQSKNRVIATLSFYSKPSDTKLVDYNTWSYSLTTPTLSGKTSDRPKYPNETWSKGRYYFDTDLGKPIWWTGEKWVDADGDRVR